MSRSAKETSSEYVELPPSPSCLVESLRDIGYSMPTAVADLIDNSITASATEVSIRFSWNEGQPWLAVIDNGTGMDQQELISAMRLGSTSPLEQRSDDDLGRFGLGMKTASFSQCRHLTVVSKTEGNKPFSYEWNLDKLGSEADSSWRLTVVPLGGDSSDPLVCSLCTEYLDGYDSGTIVLWRNMDRVAAGEAAETRESVLDAHMDDVRDHLQRVFHRLLAGSRGQSKINMTINNDPLEPFDPFHASHPATQELPEQVITLDGKKILVQPYVLPHHSKTSREEWEKYAGVGGYLHNQGFYVYRNKRLIISGTWFRLLKKQELTKLVRVRIDIPNSFDHLWGIDVKKSHASPPERVRLELRGIIERIEYRGKRVYQQRGTVLAGRAQVPAWNRVAKGGGVSYEINQKHPLLKRLLDNVPPPERALLRDLVAVLESGFPKDLYYSDVANTPETVVSPQVDDDSLREMLMRFLEFYAPKGAADTEMVEQLTGIEPFASNKELTRQILLGGQRTDV